MAKEKQIKTNAMRLLDKEKIAYTVHEYEVDDHIDGISVADKTGQNRGQVFKTLVTKGKSNNYFVFVIPVAEELDLKKAAKAVDEKAVEMIPVKEINQITGYIRGGCSPVGMKKMYQTVIHTTAQDFNTILVSGGKIGSQIELAPQELVKVTKGKFSDIRIQD